MLPRLVGENVAKELVFTGEIVDADCAHDLELVNHVYPESEFDNATDELIEDVAQGPTVALRYAKRLVSEGLEKSFEEALADEVIAQALPFDSADHAEGIAAFMEDHEPVYKGR